MKRNTKVRLNTAGGRSTWQVWIEQGRKRSHCIRCTRVLSRHLGKCNNQGKEKEVGHKIRFIFQYTICLHCRLLRRMLGSHAWGAPWPTSRQCLLAKCLFFSWQTWWHSSVTSVSKLLLKTVEFSVDKKPTRCHFCVILYFSFTSWSTCFGQPCAHLQELTNA